MEYNDKVILVACDDWEWDKIQIDLRRAGLTKSNGRAVIGLTDERRIIRVASPRMMLGYGFCPVVVGYRGIVRQEWGRRAGDLAHVADRIDPEKRGLSAIDDLLRLAGCISHGAG